MRWFGALGAFSQPQPPVMPQEPPPKPWEATANKAMDAVEILIACERRLADDDTLLGMCNDFLGETEEPERQWIGTSICFSFCDDVIGPYYSSQPATDAVRKERNQIRVRIATAKLATAKAAVEVPKKKRKRA